MKVTKGIADIGRQLISMFLVLVISLTLLTSPAIAAVTTYVTNENYQNMVLDAQKPVIVILASERVLKEAGTSLEELKSKAGDFFGRTKVAIGNIDDGLEIEAKVLRAPYVYPTPSRAVVFQSGEVTKFTYFTNPNDPTKAFEEIQKFLD